MAVAALVSLRLARSIFGRWSACTPPCSASRRATSHARVASPTCRSVTRSAAGRHLDHLLDRIDDKTRALQRWGANSTPRWPSAPASWRSQRNPAAQRSSSW
jgi:two-component system NtrC family sensor kinase